MQAHDSPFHQIIRKQLKFKILVFIMQQRFLQFKFCVSIFSPSTTKYNQKKKQIFFIADIPDLFYFKIHKFYPIYTTLLLYTSGAKFIYI